MNMAYINEQAKLLTGLYGPGNPSGLLYSLVGWAPTLAAEGGEPAHSLWTETVKDLGVRLDEAVAQARVANTALKPALLGDIGTGVRDLVYVLLEWSFDPAATGAAALPATRVTVAYIAQLMGVGLADTQMWHEAAVALQQGGER